MPKCEYTEAANPMSSGMGLAQLSGLAGVTMLVIGLPGAFRPRSESVILWDLLRQTEPALCDLGAVKQRQSRLDHKTSDEVTTVGNTVGHFRGFTTWS